MPSSPVYDHLIVGQGLAGSMLAWQLLQRGQTIMVIDNGHETAASRVAAGLVNPVTGMRLVKTVHADRYLSAADECYASLQTFFDRRFFHAREMLRLVRSEKEQQVLEKRRADPAYTGYLGNTYPANSQSPFRDPLGSFQQYRTGYLDTVTFLDGLRDYLASQHSYRRETIHVRDIRIDEKGVDINGLRARQIVFCEGYKAMHNPWFDWLPFQPARGEILTLTLAQVPTDRIINGSKWLLPLSGTQEGLFRFGASYERAVLDERITDAARAALLEELDKLFVTPPAHQLVSQQAGVRPCTKDTLPFLGRHPQKPRLAIFNGFGSKGTMMIPYYARRFADFLLEKDALPKEADIKRFWLSNT